MRHAVAIRIPCQVIAAELHALLTAAEVPPPYVLVGHSFGGLTIRAYAASHPEDVAGLVFVDPAHPEEWQQPSAGDRERLQRKPSGLVRRRQRR